MKRLLREAGDYFLEWVGRGAGGGGSLKFRL